MPAKLNWGINNWYTKEPLTQIPGNKPFAPMRRTRNKKSGDVTDSWSTDGSVGGDAVREVAVGYLPAGFVDDLNKSNKIFDVDGVYEYCDELGRYECRTFSLAYQHLPFGTWRIMSNQNCPDRKYLGDTSIGPDEEPLDLCVRRNAPAFPNR
jgi:hypothetical protein